MLSLSRNIWCFVVAFLVVAGPWVEPASASAISGFYREAVPVASQSQGDRRRAASQGLAAVLVRIAGSKDILQHETVREALSQGDGYLAQFTYQRAESITDASETGGYQLVMEFQPEATTALLHDAGLPVWSGKRPRILAWIELSDGASRQIVSVSGPGEWPEAVREAARRRGLPVVLPGSVRGVEAADVARQLDAELVYSGSVRTSGVNCSSQWSATLDGSLQQWSFAGANQQCAERAIDQLAEAMAARYAVAVTAGGGQQVAVQVAGVRRFEDYAALTRMLTELSAVRSVLVHSAAEDRVRFSVQLRGNQESLERALALQSLLVESEPQPPTLEVPATPASAATQSPAQPAVTPGTAAVTQSQAAAVDPIIGSQPALYYRLRTQPYAGG